MKFHNMIKHQLIVTRVIFTSKNTYFKHEHRYDGQSLGQGNWSSAAYKPSVKSDMIEMFFIPKTGS